MICGDENVSPNKVSDNIRYGKRITNGRFFHIHSLVSKSNEKTVRSFIDDMQALYNSINRDTPDNIYKEHNCKSIYIEL